MASFQLLPKQTYLSGRYKSPAISIPQGETRFTCVAMRPNTALGESSWIDRGTGGNVQKISGDNDVTAVSNVNSLDTEVAQLFYFLSDDNGLTWMPFGHAGFGGGIVTAYGQEQLISGVINAPLTDSSNPDRLFQAVLYCREDMDTGVVLTTNDKPVIYPILPTHRSIAFESSVSQGAANSSGFTTSGNITPANDRRYMTCAVGLAQSTTADTVTALDFNTSEDLQANPVFQSVGHSTVEYRLDAYELTNPTATAAAISVTSSGTSLYLNVAAMAFSDVDQTTPSNTPGSLEVGTDTTPAADLGAAVAADEMGVGFTTGRQEATDVQSATGQDEREDVNNIGSQDYFLAAATKNASESDQTFDWTITGGAQNTLSRAFTINEDVGGGEAAVFIPQHPMLRYRKVRR